MGLRFLSDVLQRYAGLHLSGCLGSLVRIHVFPQNKQCSFQEKYSEDDLRDRLTEVLWTPGFPTQQQQPCPILHAIYR